MQKGICILNLYLFSLHRFRNELARSLTNRNHFLVYYVHVSNIKEKQSETETISLTLLIKYLVQKINVEDIRLKMLFT